MFRACGRGPYEEYGVADNFSPGGMTQQIAYGTVVQPPLGAIIRDRSAVSPLSAESDNAEAGIGPGLLVLRLADPYRCRVPARCVETPNPVWYQERVPGDYARHEQTIRTTQMNGRRVPLAQAERQFIPHHERADVTPNGPFGISNAQLMRGRMDGFAGRMDRFAGVVNNLTGDPPQRGAIQPYGSLTGVGLLDPRFERSQGMLGMEANYAPGDHAGWHTRGAFTPAEFRPVNTWFTGRMNGHSF